MEKIVLIVDDNPELLSGVKLTLEMEGFQALTAQNGKEALEVLERITPDLILADIMMPEMDGYELYEQVHQREDWVKVPFIFLTAKTDVGDIRRGKEMGVDDYITKPFEPEDIVAAIKGRMKRLDEVSGKTMPGDGLWQKKVGPVPLPLMAIAGLVVIGLLVGLPLLSPTATPSQAAPGDIGEVVTIPAGEFISGDADSSQRINLPTFKIDKYEVVNAQYQQFVEATGHDAPWGTYPTELADYPVTNVSWEDAQTFCEWAGKRLPSEAEWEKAARGDDGRLYPWGNDWDATLANTQESQSDAIQQAGSYPDGVSPYEIHDMAGNVSEWVDNWFDPSQQAKVIRGGSANAVKRWAQTFVRNQAPPNFKLDTLGFRCAE